MPGLFSTFNIATRGMSVQQSAIDITSHNISNANTDGYSRQRAVIETTRPFGSTGLNNAAGPGQLGTGSQISTIQRVRDTFIDYQYRTQNSTQGMYNARDTYLSEIENIFNEPSDTGISTLIGKFFSSWQELAKQPDSSDARTVVAQQSSSLANALNNAYKQLQTLKENTQTEIKNTVSDVNSTLDQLDDINQQIIGVNISGQSPNDLMDKRDNLLDTLSTDFNISVSSSSFDGEDISPADDNNMLNPYLVKSESNSDVRRISYINSIDTPVYDPSMGAYSIKIHYYKKGDTSSEANGQTITLTGIKQKDLQSVENNLNESRVLWGDKDGTAITAGGSQIKDGSSINYEQLKLFNPSDGELKGYMSLQQDVDTYINQLNSLAKTLAFSVNAVESGLTSAKDNSTIPATIQTTDKNGNIINVAQKDYMPFFVNNDTASKYYGSDNKIDPDYIDEVLNSEQDINAGNISVNEGIISDPMQIKTRKNDDKFAYASDNNVDGSTDGTRALAISQLKDALIQIQNIGTSVTTREDLFDSSKGGSELDPDTKGIVSNENGITLDNYFNDTIDKLGVQEQEAKRMVTNQQTLLDSLDQSRESVSGVSLDEELANLIQYQHTYQANAKVISTVDNLLDVIINGLIK